MKVDIIIPTCKSLGSIVPLLHELRNTCEAGGEIIATCKKVSAAANRNIGLERATTDLVIMVDDDTQNFAPGWDRKLASVLEQDPACVMSSARLMQPNGQLGHMLGHPPALENGELWEVPRQELPTACICFRKTDLRFDEDFIGSGWEDTAFCAALRTREPKSKFIVHGGVRIVHVNEQKHQGVNFDRNRATYVKKWGEPR